MDLIKAKSKNVHVKGKDIKNVYEVLSGNKTGEIQFVKVVEEEERLKREREETMMWEGGRTGGWNSKAASAASTPKT